MRYHCFFEKARPHKEEEVPKLRAFDNIQRLKKN
jgi:hypothetical protein